ncbi:expressed unknown protein [Seminavis robusta]|uniref:Uncharacterized protein n=1 Tax=Seminavis robusta TaxID=568900 RepID=A0A9N8EHV6_9STRA|nr:expressed unknown protein [Seminavis robusta]|eukprot:Sro1026_g232870.1 n/a (666) ;mRNA; r:12152-14249
MELRDMQRPTIATRDPWDKPVSIPDPHVAVSRMSDTSRRGRDIDAMGYSSRSNDGGGNKGVPPSGCDSSACTDTSRNLFRNFHRSEEAFYSNVRAATVSPGSTPTQTAVRRRSYRGTTVPRLPPRVTSLDSAITEDSFDENVRFDKSMTGSSRNISSSFGNDSSMDYSRNVQPTTRITPTQTAMRRRSYSRPMAPRLPPRVTSLDSAKSDGSNDSGNKHQQQQLDRSMAGSSRNIWGNDMSMEGSSGLMVMDQSSNRNISAKAFSTARRMAEAHRRQRNKRWERKLCDASERSVGPEVTSPHTSKRNLMADESIEKHLQDQQRRSDDSIPPHVDVMGCSSSNNNNHNSMSTFGGLTCADLDDDEITFYSRSPGSLPARNNTWAHEKSEEEMPRLQPMSEAEQRASRMRRSSFTSNRDGQVLMPPQEPEQQASRRRSSTSLSAGSKEGPVPTFLDKSYLRNLAARHRNSMYSRSASGVGSEGGGDRYGGSRSSTPGAVSPPESPPQPHHLRPRRPSTSFRSQPRPTQTRRPSLPMQQQHSPPPRDYHHNDGYPAQHQQRQPEQPQPGMIEICPGLSVPLRGSDETRNAVANKFYATNILCFGCATEICTIADVQYTICPHCKIISPVEDDTFDGEKLEYRWGLGLGFTRDDLRDMQAEIAAAAFAY